MITVQDMQGKYDLFNGDDPSAIVKQFAEGGVYKQLDSGKVAIGRDEIAEVMAGWKHFFTGAQIQDVTVTEAPHLARDFDGAEQCFVVDFVGVGVYDNTIPGLEQAAPAKGQEVHLPIGETVWVDGDGKFLQVENTIQITALQ